MPKNSSKKKNQRQKAKHPGLEKKYNLKLRQDYLEGPGYVNGVLNSEGEMVMRPLNEEEREFLHKFNEEVVGSNFLHDSELKALHEKMKVFKRLEKMTPEQEEEFMLLAFEYEQRAHEVLLYPEQDDQGSLYAENNARNRCIYNRSKAGGLLYNLEPERYDEDLYCCDTVIDPLTKKKIVY